MRLPKILVLIICYLAQEAGTPRVRGCGTRAHVARVALCTALLGALLLLAMHHGTAARRGQSLVLVRDSAAMAAQQGGAVLALVAGWAPTACVWVCFFRSVARFGPWVLCKGRMGVGGRGSQALHLYGKSFTGAGPLRHENGAPNLWQICGFEK